MRLLVPSTVLLLLIASSSVHAAAPTLRVEDVTVPDAVPLGGTAEAAVDLTFHCANQAEVQPDDWVITTDVALPGGFHAEAGPTDPIPGDTCPTGPTVPFTVPLSLHVPADAEPGSPYLVVASFRAVPDGDSPLSDPSPELRVELVLRTQGEPRDGNDTLETVDDAPEEDTPGPALPLLLGLLAGGAAVRRRRGN